MVVKRDDQESTKSTSETFLEIFFAIDKDHDEEITKNQLKRYFETNHRDDHLIEVSRNKSLLMYQCLQLLISNVLF